MRKPMRGMTLIEVMIAVIIVGILVGIAVPSYQKYIRRARRVEIQVEMAAAAQRMERAYTANSNQYIATALHTSSFYTLTVGVSNKTVGATILTNGDYTLTATPIGGQTKDGCGALTLTADGKKTAAGSVPGESCWN